MTQNIGPQIRADVLRIASVITGGADAVAIAINASPIIGWLEAARVLLIPSRAASWPIDSPSARQIRAAAAARSAAGAASISLIMSRSLVARR